MALDYTKKTKRQTVDVFDVLHVLIGFAILVIAVIIFCDVEKNVDMVPLVFGGAGLLFTLDFVHRIRNLPRGKKPWGSVIISFFLALLFFFLGIVSWIAVL